MAKSGYPPCPFCQSTDIAREKHPNGKTWCNNCRRNLGNYDVGIIPILLEYDIQPIQAAYQRGDWEAVAGELQKIGEQTAGPVFIDRAMRAAFGHHLKDLGCKCPQVFSIVANKNGVGCETCQVILVGAPFDCEEDDGLWPDD